MLINRTSKKKWKCFCNNLLLFIRWSNENIIHFYY